MKLKKGLSYDDVLLVPQYSKTKSRKDISLDVKLCKGVELEKWKDDGRKLNVLLNNSYKFSHPVIPANMKTISGKEMALAVFESGGLAIVHRFMTIEEQLDMLKSFHEIDKALDHIGFSVGVRDEDWNDTKSLIDGGAKILCIDIAHGHSEQCIKTIKRIKEANGNILLIAGNVATGRGATALWGAGADVVKVGIGGGCFVEGTRILMADGSYNDIEKVAPGDSVINQEGNPVKVLDAFCTGVKEVITIQKDGFWQETRVTPDHRFLASDDEVNWISVSDIKNHKLLYPSNINFTCNTEFEYLDEETSITFKPSYELGYLFSSFLLSGQLYESSVRFRFVNDDCYDDLMDGSEIANKLLDVVDHLVGGHHSFTYEFSTTKGDGDGIDDCYYSKLDIYDPSLVRLLKEFMSMDNEFWGNSFPKQFLVNDKQYLYGILESYYENGFIRPDGKLHDASREASELFYFASHNTSGLFCASHYSFNKKPEDKYTLLRDGVGLQFEQKQALVYDITVDCPTHSFIANNMIVHNSLCTTRIETGNGVPQLTALMDVSEARKDGYEHKGIISDGGIKNSGDVVKSLCFADMVMVGNLFSGCTETPGDAYWDENSKSMVKEYNGSSTHKTEHIEGVKAIVKEKGPYKDILERLLQGIRSGCSYQGVSNVKELQDDPEFIKITPAGMRESLPHDVKVVG